VLFREPLPVHRGVLPVGILSRILNQARGGVFGGDVMLTQQFIQTIVLVIVDNHTYIIESKEGGCTQAIS